MLAIALLLFYGVGHYATAQDLCNPPSLNQTAPNPDFPGCQAASDESFKVILVLDESGSIRGRGAIGQVEAAVIDFALTLSNAASDPGELELALVEFSAFGDGRPNDASAAIGLPLTDVKDAGFLPAVQSYLTTGYNPQSARTNFFAPLDLIRSDAQLSQADIIFFITDGEPNEPRNNVQSFIRVANELKCINGTYMFAIGVELPNQNAIDNLLLLSGPDRFPDLSLRDGADYSLETFDNLATCLSILAENLVDNIPPTITVVQGESLTFPHDPGTCGTQLNSLPLEPNDACEIASFECKIDGQVFDPQVGFFFPVGNTSVVCKAVDEAGNMHEETFVITVVDEEPPAITCPSDMVVDSAPGECAVVVAYEATATDNCDTPTLSYSIPPGSPFPVGITEVTAIATDASGNMSTCTFEVTVNDIEPPSIICPADLTIEGCSTLPDPSITGEPISSDNCGSVSITSSDENLLLNSCTDGLWVITRTWIAEDGNGNTSSCEQVITIVDTTPPTFECPVDVTIECGASTDPADLGEPTNIIDNCFAAGFETETDFTDEVSTGPDGLPIITRTWLVKDWCDNASTCEQIITTVDNVPPVAVCQNLTVQLDPSGVAEVDASQVDNGSSDDCGEITLALAPSVFTCADLGTNTVVLTVTDGSGNQAACAATVTVEDNIAPSFTCPGDITVANDPGACGAVVDFEAITSDNCNLAIVNYSQAPGTFFPEGTTYVVAIAIDISGNSTSCIFGVTVEDNEAPEIISCADNVIIDVDANCEASLPDITGGLIASDNCNSFVVTQSPAAGTTIGLGTTTVTMTVTDDAGNSSICEVNVDVQDQTPPSISCPDDVTITCDASTDPALTGEATASDNCDDNVALDFVDFVNPGACPNASTISRTWMAIDNSGNSSACIQTITVVDWEPPLVPADYPDDLVLQCASEVPAPVDLTAEDNCDNAPITVSPTQDISYAANGVDFTIIRTWTFVDACGNSASVSQTIDVEDTTPPALSCPGNIFVDNDEGDCGATVNFDLQATDNCAGVVINASHASGSFFPVGETEVTVTAIDGAGNTDECSFTVTVSDKTPPVALCQDLTVALDANGFAAITGAFLDGGSSDNCGIATVVASKTTFDCNNVGVNEVKLTVTDASGNVSSCTTSVTITATTGLCNEPPVAVCQDITVNADADCLGHAEAVDFDGGSSDPDGDALILSVSPEGPYPLGTTAVTLTVSDGEETSTCTATVTVEDNTPPVLEATAEWATMWPPNHKFRTFGIGDLGIVVGDNCADLTEADVTILSVSSDEPVDELGDGKTDPDIIIASDCRSVDLRSERLGNRNARFYTITVGVSDGVSQTTAEYKVVVAHDLSGRDAIDDGPAHAVTCGESARVASGVEAIETQLMATTIYPNPAEGVLHVSFAAQQSENLKVELLALSGRKISTLFDGQVKDGQAYEWTYDRESTVKAGLYLVSFQGDKTREALKVYFRD